MDSNIGARAAQAERRVEEAKDSLAARLEDLGRRLNDAKLRLELESRIIEHPLAAVGIAFALGAAIGGIRLTPRGPKREGERRISRAVFSGLGALALRVGRDYALRRAAHAAKGYMEQRGTSRRERSASRDPSVEPFLEH